jgi:hypothetical protein
VLVAAGGRAGGVDDAAQLVEQADRGAIALQRPAGALLPLVVDGTYLVWSLM